MTTQQKTIDAVVLYAVELVAAATKPSIKAIRNSVEGILCPNYPERNEGMGRESLRKYIVARCYVQSPEDFARGSPLPADIEGHRHINANPTARYSGWDNRAAEIIEARRKYDAGTHDMVQARDGDWLIMYAIPRRRRPEFHVPHFTPIANRSQFS